MSVGAVYDRAVFLESTKYARSQTAPTADSSLLGQAPDTGGGGCGINKMLRSLLGAADGVVGIAEVVSKCIFGISRRRGSASIRRSPSFLFKKKEPQEAQRRTETLVLLVVPSCDSCS